MGRETITVSNEDYCRAKNNPTATTTTTTIIILLPDHTRKYLHDELFEHIDFLYFTHTRVHALRTLLRCTRHENRFLLRARTQSINCTRIRFGQNAPERHKRISRGKPLFSPSVPGSIRARIITTIIIILRTILQYKISEAITLARSAPAFLTATTRNRWKF